MRAHAIGSSFWSSGDKRLLSISGPPRWGASLAAPPVVLATPRISGLSAFWHGI
jgi:hypothetical protein